MASRSYLWGILTSHWPLKPFWINLDFVRLDRGHAEIPVVLDSLGGPSRLGRDHQPRRDATDSFTDPWHV